MKISLNEPVSSLDGPFGEVGDIVVDPTTSTVTHLVVEPHHRHYQARLVPISLIDSSAGSLTVQLDEHHLRALQQVAESDFVPISQPIELGPDWDVGVEHVVVPPYSFYGYDVWPHAIDQHMTVSYDRIPKGDCEIRRESAVASSDGHLVGTVDSLVVEDDHISAVLVESGVVLRHRVAVPISTVDRVRTDEIRLSIDKATFKQLVPVARSGEPDASRLETMGRVAATASKKVSGRVRSWVSRDR